MYIASNCVQNLRGIQCDLKGTMTKAKCIKDNNVHFTARQDEEGEKGEATDKEFRRKQERYDSPEGTNKRYRPGGSGVPIVAPASMMTPTCMSVASARRQCTPIASDRTGSRSTRRCGTTVMAQNQICENTEHKKAKG